MEGVISVSSMYNVFKIIWKKVLVGRKKSLWLWKGGRIQFWRKALFSLVKGWKGECHPCSRSCRHEWTPVVFVTQDEFTFPLVKYYDSPLGNSHSTNLCLWSLSDVDSTRGFGCLGVWHVSGLASNISHPWPLRWFSESQTQDFHSVFWGK